MFWVAKYNFPDISLNLPEKPFMQQLSPYKFMLLFPIL